MADFTMDLQLAVVAQRAVGGDPRHTMLLGVYYVLYTPSPGFCSTPG
ncbi:MAG: hypothetical protein U1E40_01725 [Amaricoccus sp.]